MWADLIDIAACIECGGRLGVDAQAATERIVDGLLRCDSCGAEFAIKGDITRLSSPEQLQRVADRWPEGTLTQELFRRNIESNRRLAQENCGYARCVEVAGDVEGVIVDVATGPGSGMCGALAPRLRDGKYLVMADASEVLMRGLSKCWAEVPQMARIDFWLFDANKFPFRDGSVDCVTSNLGFSNVRRDRQAGGWGGPTSAYTEAQRSLKPGGLLVDTVRVYGENSKTAALKREGGSVHASRETLEQFWASIGLRVVEAHTIRSGVGKSDPADGLPIDEADQWEDVAYILRRG